MHIIQTHVPMRTRSKVYLPNQRPIVTDVGMAGLDGFNIGKMFKRMVHFTPRSFQPKNIFGAIGSITATTLTGGLAPIISGKTFGAHSALMKDVGMGVSAAALAAGAVIAAPVVLPTIGSALTSVGSLGTGLLSTIGGGAMKMFGGMFGGGGGVYGGSGVYMGPQAVVDPNALIQPQSGQMQYPSQDVMNQATQAVPQMIAQSLSPTSYPTMPDPSVADSSAVDPNAQLQSPSSQDFQTINPVTGQPMISVSQDYTSYYLIGGGVALVGLYYYMNSK